MSTIYVSDPWDGLSPGFSGAPPGWTLFGSSTVFASDGAFPGHNFGNGFFSPLNTPVFSDPNPSTAAPLIQCMFGAQVNNAFQFQVSIKDLVGNPRVVLSLIRQGDQSLSLKTGFAPTDFLLCPSASNERANSGLITSTYFYQHVWYYFQLNIGVETDPGGSGNLKVTSDLIVDGQAAIPASNAAILPLSLFQTTGGGATLVSEFDQCSWFGDPNVSYLTQVQISDQGVGVPDPTHPIQRIPQAVIEPGVVPVNANIRIPQAVIESSILPVTANIRIPQMVIELATPFIQRGGPLPEYIKRRNLFANN